MPSDILQGRVSTICGNSSFFFNSSLLQGAEESTPEAGRADESSQFPLDGVDQHYAEKRKEDEGTNA